MVSTTGPQALTFFNGAFVHQQAGHFASRLIAEAGESPSHQVERAFASGPGPASACPTRRGPRSSSSTSKSDKSGPKPPARQTTVDAVDARRKALEAFCSGCFEHERVCLQTIDGRLSKTMERGDHE